MKLRLSDIIDLEYLVRLDDDLETREEIHACQIRDRDIYSRMDDKGGNKKTLLLNWLAHRKIQYQGGKESQGFSTLPGTLFSKLYKAMVYLMVFSGLFSGLPLATSFLAYYGARPINVTLFVFVFILLPLILVLLSVFFMVYNMFRNRKENAAPFFPGVHAFLSTLMFKGLPRVLQKLDWQIFQKGIETIETGFLVMKMRKKQYKGLFFWPFFVLTSVFSISFSTGALVGTFFRVIVSDMAFGWQSTILMSSKAVHAIVSAMARPWSGWIPISSAHPGLEQIEGSRIILKDGISVMATQDLVSWWPFLCMGIFFYAILPRGVLILTGVWAQRRALRGFDFNMSGFNDLIARMQSPVLSVNIADTPISHASEENPIKQMDSAPESLEEPVIKGQSAIVLLSEQVYAKDAEKTVLQWIEANLFYQINQVVHIGFDFEADESVIRTIDPERIDQAILVQEVWQPPIRGLLYYIDQLQKALPNEMPVFVLLTKDAGQPELSVAQDDIDFEVWKKAVVALGNSKIRVKRLV